MRGIFTRLGIKPTIELAVEMISVQKNDYVVDALNLEFEKVIKNIKNSSVSGERVYKDRRVRPHIENIDSILFERFGISFKHVYSKRSGYSVYTVPPKNYNILNKGVEKHYREVEEYIDTIGLKDSDVKSKEEITNSDKDLSSVIHNWKQSIDSLEEQLFKDGVTVNLEKAKIMGLPKDYNVFLISDLYLMVKEVDLTAEELTAVLLHEVGHAFTHLEYSVRTVNNTSVLLDAIISNAEVKNKPFKESMIIAYEQLDGKRKDIEKGSRTTVFIKLMDRYIRSSLNMGSNTHHVTDSEQLADQFTVRFGVGMYTATGLEKIISTFGKIEKNTMINGMVTSYLIGTVYALILTGSMVATVTMPLVGLALMFTISGIFSVIDSAITSGGMVKGMVYDYDDKRFQRIRNDMVRNLRQSSLPKAVVKQRLEEIERLDEIISKAKTAKELTSGIDKVFRSITPTGRVLVENKQIDEAIEELMENDLHVASNKLRTI